MVNSIIEAVILNWFWASDSNFQPAQQYISETIPAILLSSGAATAGGTGPVPWQLPAQSVAAAEPPLHSLAATAAVAAPSPQRSPRSPAATPPSPAAAALIAAIVRCAPLGSLRDFILVRSVSAGKESLHL